MNEGLIHTNPLLAVTGIYCVTAYIIGVLISVATGINIDTNNRGDGIGFDNLCKGLALVLFAPVVLPGLALYGVLIVAKPHLRGNITRLTKSAMLLVALAGIASMMYEPGKVREGWVMSVELGDAAERIYDRDETEYVGVMIHQGAHTAKPYVLLVLSLLCFGYVLAPTINKVLMATLFSTPNRNRQYDGE